MTTSKELRELRRRQAAERNKAKDVQKRQRERLSDNLEALQAGRVEKVRRHNAVVTGMVPRISGAIDSWCRKRVPLQVTHPAARFMAATDFHSITINIPEVTGDVDLDFAADLRGLAYHEAGHILVSVPFVNLIEAALPLGEDGTHSDRTKFIKNAYGLSTDNVHRAWNCLEDQRMESTMVAQSKNLGRYYNVIVLTHVLAGGLKPEAYTVLYGRQHVDEKVRTASFHAFVSKYDARAAEQVENLIDAYKQADDLGTMWETVIRFALVLQSLQADRSVDSVDQHEDGDELGADEAEDRAEQTKCPVPTTPSDEDGEGDAEGAGSSKSDEDGEEYEVLGDTADRGAATGTDDIEAPGASQSIGDPDWTRDFVREALEQAKEERRHDGNVVNDVRAFNEAMADSKGSLPLARIPYTVDPDPQVTAEAIALNRAIRNLMEQARAESAPSWQENQPNGFLNVNRYLTRQTGDTDFYRNYAPGGDMRLPNMAVSVLLDGSGSMSRRSQQLAMAAFGMKSACDVTDVPCTVTIYDTDAYLLWDADDRPLDVPYNIVPNGGTEPKKALDMLDFQKHEKANHLIIIMTDGAWSGLWHSQYSLAHYQAPDRDIVMFYLGCDPSHGPAGAETCALVQRIDDLQEMPRFLMRYLTRAM